jgi:PBP1b-binding outer membrane lipoprotein LpoB
MQQAMKTLIALTLIFAGCTDEQAAYCASVTDELERFSPESHPDVEWLDYLQQEANNCERYT